MAKKHVGGRRKLTQINLEGGRRGVARGQGWSLNARALPSEPRSHGPSLGDGPAEEGPAAKLAPYYLRRQATHTRDFY
ncbi:MAG: hypothetical protein RL499_393 [Actinomycetota bacterium]